MKLSRPCYLWAAMALSLASGLGLASAQETKKPARPMATPAWLSAIVGQPGVIEVKAEARWPLELSLPAGVKAVDVWDCTSPNVALFEISAGRCLFFAKANGAYIVTAWGVQEGKAARLIRYSVTVGDSPEPPIPPTPDPPKPDPPKPDPPSPAPIPVAGLRVLIVFESMDATKMELGHQAIVYGAATRKFINDACVKVGNQPEYRIYDKDTAMDGESKLWQDAMKRPRQSLPWVIISNGVSGYEGPLPMTPDAMKALVAKYQK